MRLQMGKWNELTGLIAPKGLVKGLSLPSLAAESVMGEAGVLTLHATWRPTGGLAVHSKGSELAGLHTDPSLALGHVYRAVAAD